MLFLIGLLILIEIPGKSSAFENRLNPRDKVLESVQHEQDVDIPPT